MLTPCSSIEERACRKVPRRRRFSAALSSSVCSLLSTWRGAGSWDSTSGCAKSESSSVGISLSSSPRFDCPVCSGAGRKYMTRPLRTRMRNTSRDSSSTTRSPNRLDGRKFSNELRSVRSRTSRRDSSSFCATDCPLISGASPSPESSMQSSPRRFVSALTSVPEFLMSPPEREQGHPSSPPLANYPQ